MKRRGGVHHIDLSVSNLRRSAVFYDRVLVALGYQRIRLPGSDESEGFDWRAPADSGFWSTIGMYQAKARRKLHDRSAPGLHHLALHAKSRAAVNRLHRLLVRSGVTILESPREYPIYGEGYYAVFFLDPDGIKLEIVHDPSVPLREARF